MIKSLIITLVLLICGFITFLSFKNNIYLPWRNSQLKKETSELTSKLKICQNENFKLILKKLREEYKSKKKLEELTTLKRDMTTYLKSYRDIERQIIEKRFKKEDSMKLTKKLEELATEFERLKKLVKLVDPAEYD